MQAAVEQGTSSHSRPILITFDGEPKQVVLQVRPSNDPELGNLHLVMFDEYEVAEGAPSAPIGPEATDARVELEANSGAAARGRRAR